MRLSCAALALGLCPAAFGTLINGGFEPGPGGATAILPPGSTLIPGWVATDSGAEWFLPAGLGYANSPQGGYVVDLANYIYNAGGVAQTFATTPGQAYEIRFYYGTHAAFGRDGTAEIIVAAGATSQTYSIVNAGSQIIWEERVFTFTADAPTTTLSFRCLQSGYQHFAYIDGASKSEVPAPGGLVLAVLGALAGRRRR